MKLAAALCNILLFGFTCVVLIVDDLPSQPGYIALTLWLLVTPILSTVVITRGWLRHDKQLPEVSAEQSSSGSSALMSPGLRVCAIFFNVVLLAAICWAFIEQYSHPREDGFVAFVVLTLLAPILSVAVLAGRRVNRAG